MSPSTSIAPIVARTSINKRRENCRNGILVIANAGAAPPSEGDKLLGEPVEGFLASGENPCPVDSVGNRLKLSRGGDVILASGSGLPPDEAPRENAPFLCPGVVGMGMRLSTKAEARVWRSHAGTRVKSPAYDESFDARMHPTRVWS
mmetsp:Transcript_66907/g.158672  ORF Transcript_66907/g.158672 Transcript_66907/m.158672 type:complete len:147 (-) Transcript_66907:457-897(-)